MAANKWTKWMVGLSSVAAFTTFVGLSQKYDQTILILLYNNNSALSILQILMLKPQLSFHNRCTHERR